MTRLIFHITHLNNLRNIITDGCLWSDRHMAQQGTATVIGYNHIKQRRLQLAVDCHAGLCVGDFVPFYFCPRSTMLYVISRGNADLQYRGGQRQVVHLVSTVTQAITLAAKRPWAYSDGNAGAAYTCFYKDLSRIDEVIDWKAVGARDWRDPAIKEKKQAEFLVHDRFDWEGFHEIGVYDATIAAEVTKLLLVAKHRPVVKVKPEWYY